MEYHTLSFFRKLGKMLQNMLSAAEGGALRVDQHIYWSNSSASYIQQTY